MNHVAELMRSVDWSYIVEHYKENKEINASNW